MRENNADEQPQIILIENIYNPIFEVNIKLEEDRESD